MDSQNNQTADALAAVTHQLKHLAQAYLEPLLTQLKQQSEESLVQDALDVFQDALLALQATAKTQMTDASEQVGWDVGHEIEGVKVDHPQYGDAFHVLAERQQDWAADPAHMKLSLDHIDRTLAEILRLCTAHYLLTRWMMPEAHFEHQDFHSTAEVFIGGGAVMGYLQGLFSAIKRHEVAGFLGQDAQTVIGSVFS